jgi:hypothetical protein
MFDQEKIVDAAKAAHIVGFREDGNAIYSGLDNFLKGSNLFYVNDLPAVNFQMIDAALSTDENADEYLTAVYESELINLVNQFTERNKTNYESKELLSNKTIVDGIADKIGVQNKRFVGFSFKPHRSNNLNIKITALGVQSTATQETLKIFLYETSQQEPIATFDFPITKEKSLTWEVVEDFILRYESETGGTGQAYLLGYYEKDSENEQDWQLQGNSVYKEFTCGCPGEPKSFYGKYMGIRTLEIGNANLNWNGTTYLLPSIDYNYLGNYETNQTYGLNAKVNVTCELTNVLVENIKMFAKPLQHAMGVRILWDAFASNRINSITDAKKEQAKQFALKYEGILKGYVTEGGTQVQGLIDLLSLDFSGLDSYCLKCKQGIKIGHLVR